ncbi:MAG: HEPN domain-containing protein [Nitrososphaerota archaeon]|nr:HEPN domain-containing protein [Nitrososphaerota archaeon]MDG6940045.1 HEPN domain-containing protein [Nitrososphaerota archaeon]
MNMLDLAFSYLRQAKPRMENAERARADSNHPYAFRLAQECTELCIKASLRAVGIEYPKQHEVSDMLVEVKERFPPWFLEEIPFVQRTSKSLFRKRELAFYGGEDRLLSPDEAIGEEDSKAAVEAGSRVYALCEKLVSELRVGPTGGSPGSQSPA